MDIICQKRTSPPQSSLFFKSILLLGAKMGKDSVTYMDKDCFYIYDLFFLNLHVFKF